MCDEKRGKAKSIYKVAPVYVRGAAGYECGCIRD